VNYLIETIYNKDSGCY